VIALLYGSENLTVGKRNVNSAVDRIGIYYIRPVVLRRS
jgi:hypothetical protein